jgi:hypothetical protein
MEDEKSFDMRDRIALEVLNGIISNAKDSDLVKELTQYLTYSSETDVSTRKEVEAACSKKIERIVRNCYKVADIVRKVRLSSFE